MLPDYRQPAHSQAQNRHYTYIWPGMEEPRTTFSRVDALLEILGLETGMTERKSVAKALTNHPETISRMRATNEIEIQILLKAAIFANIDYVELCKAFGEEPQVYPHQ